MKVYGFFIGNKQVGSTLWKDKEIAIKEMEMTNSQFEEYNQFIRKNKIDRELKGKVEVKEIDFDRRKNLDI